MCGKKQLPFGTKIAQQHSRQRHRLLSPDSSISYLLSSSRNWLLGVGLLNIGYVNLMAALCSSSLHSMQHRRGTPFKD